MKTQEMEREQDLACIESEKENISDVPENVSHNSGADKDVKCFEDCLSSEQEGGSGNAAECETYQCCSIQGKECVDTTTFDVCHTCKESSVCSCPKSAFVSPMVNEISNIEQNIEETEDLNDKSDVPFCNDGIADEKAAESYGNKLAVADEHGLVPTTCLNLEPDTPWDVLNGSASQDGICIPFSNGGVSMTDFSPCDIIIENPVAEVEKCYNENGEVSCLHSKQKEGKMYELSLQMLGGQSTDKCKCCTTTRNQHDSLGCSCRRTTKIVIDKNCGKSSVLVLHGEKDSQNQDQDSNCDQDDIDEIYANTLFIDMDEVGVLNEEHEPFVLPHERNLDLLVNESHSNNTDQPETDDVQESPEPEVDSDKYHTIYVCDEEDLQDVCRICHCGSEDEPLISPCQCTGSMEYIHHTCLMTWLQRTVRQNCELCQQEIPVVRRRKPITQWGLPNRRPTCFLWLLAFIVTLTLNIASITRDASQRCTTNACIVFYIVEAIGAILGFMFSCFFTVRSIRFIKLWMIHNEEWTFDILTSSDNTKTVKPQQPSKKRPNIQI